MRQLQAFINKDAKKKQERFQGTAKFQELDSKREKSNRKRPKLRVKPPHKGSKSSRKGRRALQRARRLRNCDIREQKDPYEMLRVIQYLITAGRDAGMIWSRKLPRNGGWAPP